jgi:PAS domain S-box-containing protein
MLKPIDQYSKEELYDYLTQLVQAYDVQQGGQAGEAVHSISDLLGAARMLQQDVFTIIKKFREININLEQEVQARTQELTLNEANLSALIENTSDLIISVNRKFHVRVVNQAFRRVIYNRYDIAIEPGTDLLAVCPSPLLDYWQPHFQRALAGETFKVVEAFFQPNHKSYYEFSFNPIREPNGEVSGVSFFGKDITEKQIALEEIRAQQQLLTSINYSIKEGIFRTVEGRIIYVNKAFVEMFGYDSEEEMKAVDPYDLYIDPSRRDYFVDLMQEQTFFVNEEVCFRRKDGSGFWGLISSIKSYDSQTGHAFHDGAIRDITEVKETKRQLEQQNLELTKVNQELDRFVYSTSHDLRAPLVSVAGLITVARMSQSDAERNQYLDLMEKSIHKLDGFIKDIIHYSRNARTEVVQVPIAFGPLIEDCLENLRYLDGAGNMVIDQHIEQDDSPFLGDRTRLEVILNNLISNSIRYRDATKAQPRLTLSVKVDHERATIQIADNGVGIDPKVKGKIFEMFYRGNQRSQGSGIGLYIVRETLNRLGGNIEVDSVHGQGTTFTVEIPATGPPQKEACSPDKRDCQC